jgi:urea carboxylase-associated protein 1
MSLTMNTPAANVAAVQPALDPSAAIYDHVVAARAPWSHVVRRGQSLRVIDTESQQAVDALFYNAHDFAERYSAQDTLRVQRSAYLSLGAELVSNEGRVMARVVGDTCGRHDTSAGCCSCESNAVRFGESTKYQHACRENFIHELGRHGMTKRDIVSNVNLFMNVPIDPLGNFTVLDGVSEPGGYVDIRAEMDILCVLSNCPQINNPCNGFNPTPIRVLIWDVPSA